MTVGGVDEAGEQRMRAQRLRLELRMELHGDVPRMSRQLDHLHEFSVRRAAGNPQPFVGERLLVEAVELVAMTMALVDRRRAVDLLAQRAGREQAFILSKPHRAA